MNRGLKEGELPRKFASDACNVLLVANKFQTGFDQPLLVAMYVYKRLVGVQAVQTLSRMNRPAPDIFAAQVIGESMNRRIPNGAWCIWRLNPACDGDGAEVVLARHNDIFDADLGHYTVKLYERRQLDDAGEHVEITLRPDSSDPEFKPIELRDLAEGDLRIIAELVEVLR